MPGQMLTVSVPRALRVIERRHKDSLEIMSLLLGYFTRSRKAHGPVHVGGMATYRIGRLP